MSLWTVARVDVNALEGAQLGEALAWVAGLGVDPKTVIPHLVVSQDDAGAYRLHLSRFVLADGRKVVDHAAGRVHTEPVVIPVDTYPSWLPEAGQHQIQQQAGAQG